MNKFESTWLAELDTEDINFIKKFILASGSLKELATVYEVSYPTVRLRLDRLIQKINLAEKDKEDNFITLVKKLTIDEKIDLDIAKTIITAHKNSLEESK